VAERAYGVPAERLAVVPEPVDLEVWDDQFARAREGGGARRAGPVVLCVARMYARKRIADLLRAAPRVRAAVPGVRFRVVGRGPEWDAVQRLHAELGLDGLVDLLGDVSLAELAAEYVAADVFCLPSVQEGFGIVFLEAMAAGLPVVACRAAAIPEVVLDGTTGVLTPPRDPEALAQALAALLTDRDRARALGRAGRRRAEAFSTRRIAELCLEAVRPTVARLNPREA
jgi:glycosyltransferase involved in cell wall biosynthesis